jgi:hypothetical protein
MREVGIYCKLILQVSNPTISQCVTNDRQRISLTKLEAPNICTPYLVFSNFQLLIFATPKISFVLGHCCRWKNKCWCRRLPADGGTSVVRTMLMIPNHQLKEMGHRAPVFLRSGRWPRDALDGSTTHLGGFHAYSSRRILDLGAREENMNVTNSNLYYLGGKGHNI